MNALLLTKVILAPLLFLHHRHLAAASSLEHGFDTSVLTPILNASVTATIALNFSGSPDAPPLDFRYGADGPGGAQCDSGVSVAQELISFGATLLRTHDSDVLDWTAYYPHPLLDADPSDPASYDWTAGDAYFARIVDAGLEPYLRLGTSWGVAGGGLPPDGVPYNQTALVDVLLHTVMHNNDGWGGDAGGAAGRGGGWCCRHGPGALPPGLRRSRHPSSSRAAPAARGSGFLRHGTLHFRSHPGQPIKAR